MFGTAVSDYEKDHQESKYNQEYERKPEDNHESPVYPFDKAGSIYLGG
jgi:hypothetical protein